MTEVAARAQTGRRAPPDAHRQPPLEPSFTQLFEEHFGFVCRSLQRLGVREADLEDIAQIANFARSLGNIERVDVLPFHQMGAFKWKQLGIEYKLRDAEPPSKETVERVCAQFRGEGLKVY